MAASFGKRLVGEIHEEGLDELLRNLRGSHFAVDNDEGVSRYPSLGVKELDDILDIFIPPLPQRTATRPLRNEHRHVPEEDRDMLLNDLSEDEDPAPPTISTPLQTTWIEPVVEISSTYSAAGKTQLLYQLTASAILPVQHNNVFLGGKGAAVVFIDADGRFDSRRLQTILRGLLRQKVQSGTENTKLDPPDQDIEELIVSVLRHVHVFRPESSSALLATLRNVEAYLFDLAAHFSADRSLQLIIVDSATAFLWEDKLRDEVTRVEEIGRSGFEIESERDRRLSFHISVLYADMVAELKRLQRRFHCAVVFTTVGDGSRNSDLAAASISVYPVLSFRTPLPAPWGTFPTLRLVVQRDIVRRFPPGMTPQEAEQEASIRQSVVEQGKFIACVNGWGHEDWSKRTVQGLRRKNAGAFSFYVRTDGVFIGGGPTA